MQILGIEHQVVAGQVVESGWPCVRLQVARRRVDEPGAVEGATRHQVTFIGARHANRDVGVALGQIGAHAGPDEFNAQQGMRLAQRRNHLASGLGESGRCP